MAKAQEKDANVEATEAAQTIKPKAPHEKMSGAERAAVIMLLLGEQQAADPKTPKPPAAKLKRGVDKRVKLKRKLWKM